MSSSWVGWLLMMSSSWSRSAAATEWHTVISLRGGHVLSFTARPPHSISSLFNCVCLVYWFWFQAFFLGWRKAHPCCWRTSKRQNLPKIRLNLRPRGGGTLKLTPVCWPRTKSSIMRPIMQQADLMCFLLKQTIQFLTDIMASLKRKKIIISVGDVEKQHGKPQMAFYI